MSAKRREQDLMEKIRKLPEDKLAESRISSISCASARRSTGLRRL